MAVTSFGETTRRDLSIVKLYIDSRIKLLQTAAARLERVINSWEEVGIEELEECLEEICVLFYGDCPTCPVFFCPNSKMKAEGQKI